MYYTLITGNTSMCMPLCKYCIIYMGRKRAMYSVHVNKYMYIQYCV